MGKLDGVIKIRKRSSWKKIQKNLKIIRQY